MFSHKWLKYTVLSTIRQKDLIVFLKIFNMLIISVLCLITIKYICNFIWNKIYLQHLISYGVKHGN